MQMNFIVYTDSLSDCMVDESHEVSQGCRRDGISILIPIPYPQESPLKSPWESSYPRQPWS